MGKTTETIEVKVIAASLDKLTAQLERSTGATESLHAAMHKTQSFQKAQEKLHKNHEKGAKGVAGATNNQTKAFSKMAGVISGTVVPIYATVAANVFALTASFNALRRAADFDILTTTMAEFGKITGTSVRGIAKDMRDLTSSSITMGKALRSASIGVSAGFDGATLKELTSVARNAALALGRDMEDALDRVFKGAIKAEPELLDELGIILRLEPATRRYAAELNKSVTALTTFEKQQAVVNEVIRQGQEKFSEIAELDVANTYNQLYATFDSLTTSIFNLVNTALTPFLSILSESKVALVALLAIFSVSVAKKSFKSLGAGYSLLVDGTQRWAKASEAAMIEVNSKALKYEEKRASNITEVKQKVILSYREQLKHAQSFYEELDARGVEINKNILRYFEEAADGSVAAFQKIQNSMSNLRGGIASGKVYGAAITKEEQAHGKQMLKDHDAMLKTIEVSSKATAEADAGTWRAWWRNNERTVVEARRRIANQMFALTNTVKGTTEALVASSGISGFVTTLGDQWEDAGKKGAKATRNFKRVGVGIAAIGTGIGKILGPITKITFFLSLAVAGFRGIGKFLGIITKETQAYAAAMESAKEVTKEVAEAVAYYNANLVDITPSLDNYSKQIDHQLGTISNLTGAMQDFESKQSRIKFTWLDSLVDVTHWGRLDNSKDSLEEFANTLSLFDKEGVAGLIEEFGGEIEELSKEQVPEFTKRIKELGQELEKEKLKQKSFADSSKTVMQDASKNISGVLVDLQKLSKEDKAFVSLDQITNLIDNSHGMVQLKDLLTEMSGSQLSLLGMTSQSVSVFEAAIEKAEELKKKLEEAREEQEKLFFGKGILNNIKLLFKGFRPENLKAERAAAAGNVDQASKELEDAKKEIVKHNNALEQGLRDARNKFDDLANSAKHYKDALAVLDIRKALLNSTDEERAKTILATQNAEIKYIKVQSDIYRAREDQIRTNLKLERANQTAAKKLGEEGKGALQAATQAVNSLLTEQLAIKRQIEEEDSKISKVVLTTAEAFKKSFKQTLSERDSGAMGEAEFMETLARTSGYLETALNALGISAEDVRQIMSQTFDNQIYISNIESLGTKLGVAKSALESYNLANIQYAEVEQKVANNLGITVGMLAERYDAEMLLANAKDELNIKNLEAAVKELELDSTQAEAKRNEIESLRALIKARKTSTVLLEKYYDKEITGLKNKQRANKIELASAKAIGAERKRQIALQAIEQQYIRAGIEDTAELNVLMEEQRKIIQQDRQIQFELDVESAVADVLKFEAVFERLFDSVETGARQLGLVFNELGQSIDSNFISGLGKVILVQERNLAREKDLTEEKMDLVGNLREMERLGLQDQLAYQGTKNKADEVEVKLQAVKMRGYSDMAGAMASMFEKGSKAAKAFAVVQAAAALSAMYKEGGLAIVSAAKGPFPMNFINMAAMAASVTAIIAKAGGSFGGAKIDKGGTAQAKAYTDSIGKQGLVGIDLQSNSLVESIQELTEVNTEVGSIERELQVTIGNLNDTFNRIGALTFGSFGDFGELDIESLFKVRLGQTIDKGFFNDVTETIEVLASGLEITGSIVNDLGKISVSLEGTRAFLTTKETTEESGFLGFGADFDVDVRTRFSNISSEIISELEDALEGSLNVVLGLANSFSREFGSSILNSLLNSPRILDAVSIDLTGKSAEEQSTAIAAYFSNFTNEIIEDTIPFVKEYSVAGEELTDTLGRLVKRSIELDNALSKVGLSVDSLLGDFSDVALQFIDVWGSQVAGLKETLKDPILEDSLGRTTNEIIEIYQKKLDPGDSYWKNLTSALKGSSDVNKAVDTWIQALLNSGFGPTGRLATYFQTEFPENFAYAVENGFAKSFDPNNFNVPTSLSDDLILDFESLMVDIRLGWEDSLFEVFGGAEDKFNAAFNSFIKTIYTESELTAFSITNAKNTVARGLSQFANSLETEGLLGQLGVSKEDIIGANTVDEFKALVRPIMDDVLLGNDSIFGVRFDQATGEFITSGGAILGSLTELGAAFSVLQEIVEDIEIEAFVKEFDEAFGVLNLSSRKLAGLNNQLGNLFDNIDVQAPPRLLENLVHTFFKDWGHTIERSGNLLTDIITVWTNTLIDDFSSFEDFADKFSNFSSVVYTEAELAQFSIDKANETISSSLKNLADALNEEGLLSKLSGFSGDSIRNLTNEADFANLVKQLIAIEAFAVKFDDDGKIIFNGTDLWGNVIGVGDAFATILANLDAASNKAADDFEKSIIEKLLELNDTEYSGAIRELVEEFNALKQEAFELGTNMQLVDNAFELSAKKLANTIRDEFIDKADDIAADFRSAMEDIDDLYASVNDSMITIKKNSKFWDEIAYQTKIINDSYNKLGGTGFGTLLNPENSDQSLEAQIGTLEVLREAIMARYDAELDAINDTATAAQESYDEQLENYDTLKDLAKDLNDFLDDLLLSDVSILTNFERLQEAQSQYSELLAASLSNDPTISAEAIAKLGDSARTYLDEARDYFASSQPYTDIFNEIVANLSGISGGLDILEAPLDTQTQIIQNGLTATELAIEQLNLDTISQLSTIDYTLNNLQIAVTTRFESAIAQLSADFTSVMVDLKNSLPHSIGLAVYRSIEPLLVTPSYPTFDVGSSYIPQDMTANIHQGEIIIDPQTSDALRRYGIPVSGNSNAEVVAAINKLIEVLEDTQEDIAIKTVQVKDAVEGTGEAIKAVRVPKTNVGTIL